MSETRDEGLSRRTAFKAVGLGLGGAALAAAGTAQAEGVDVDRKGGVGYHVTDHVKTFYATAKF